ncbi:precorrin-8X methylmutase [Peteryoungia ipomoeae]|uniref:Precorrin-8X methylmutase n=2 Tax=Peteryoungia ipomoeae TaxID=1210932 RepID=A0A4S8P7B5_9HYPH|nr:precorrin-8X methylmutase [Peteryoungia ipomoeae]
MPLFDRILIVDWSGAGQPVTGKNSLWACLARCEGDRCEIDWVENFSTRHAFMQRLEAVVGSAVIEGKRLLCGFDFAFGYPAGTAERLTGRADWRALWRKISDEIEDSPDNRNSRFDLASRWNATHFAGEPRFWGRPHQHLYAHLSDKRPPLPQSAPFAFRRSEQFAKGAKSVWQLTYNGSVGSQTLLGIARLSRFLDESGHGDDIAVWPFDTGFTSDFAKPVVFAEIYPSLFTLTGSFDVKDAAQVRTVAEAFGSFAADGRLASLLGRPPMLTDDEAAVSVQEEGWVLGIGHRELVGAKSVGIPDGQGLEQMDYIRDPAEIYRQSFETIRREADLGQFPPVLQPLVIRLIHACGMVELLDEIAFSEGAFEAGAAALEKGAPILVDVEMVRHGVIRRLLPAENDVICLLNDERVRPKAEEIGNTRSAAQVDLWDAHLAGAIVAIGNAPTALFRLLERIDAGAPKPAIILGFPVGFVGAAESKAELIANSRGIPYIAVRGRKGGSAMASAAINALAGGLGTNV